MRADTAVKALAAMRIGIGALAWIDPALAARLFGLKTTDSPQAPYLWRLFAVRDVVVGIGTLRASGENRRTWLKFGLVCDAGDGAAAALGQRSGYLPPSTAAALVGVPAVAVGLGALLLRADPT